VSHLPHRLDSIADRGHHLLYALTRVDHGAAADLLARYGSSAAIVNAALEGAL
jgi:hypothetical protein